MFLSELVILELKPIQLLLRPRASLWESVPGVDWRRSLGVDMKAKIPKNPGASRVLWWT